MGQFKTLLFDADNTLFDFDACEREALKLTFQKYEYPLDGEIYNTYVKLNKYLWKQYELGLMDRNTVIYSRFGTLFQQIGIQDDGIAFEDDYQELLGMQHFVYEHAEEVVKKLCLSHDMYIVTNGVTATQLSRIKDSKLDQYFKKIFVSEETGYQKPMKEYFDYCFDRIDGIDKMKTIIIGDSLSSDILGGNNAGIATCWYNPNGLINQTSAVVNYEVNSLTELYSLFDQ
jgi:HAD superfamily (subfamily IA) hydrolase, TIGR02254